MKEWKINPPSAGEIAYNDTMAEVTWADFNGIAYLYVIHNSSNCSTVSDSLEIFIGRTSSNTGNQLYQPFLIFPNPSNGKVNVDLSPLQNSPADISIYNQQGRLIERKSIEDNFSNAEFYLSKGLYFIKVETVSGVEGIEKIIIY